MTEIRLFRLFLLALSATLFIGWGTGAYYSHDSEAASDEMQAEVAAKQRAEKECIAGDQAACIRSRPIESSRSVLDVTDNDLHKFDVYSSAESAKSWYFFSTLGAIALTLLFYALRWAMTGRLFPLWPSTTNCKEDAA
ncbi:hypothetical protein [Paucibacter sp. DJ2R-2]|uniref:hypothetical protein n=1 Tax=Paucibacter sp. DJ2R-2 TaxID=2893558 RepID=UPI0021E48317|nr:hypothetical protein [Paucibacter sp. DJ2R-2]MCV2439857.1 hypothetical protein [Paucibacter sp. DJ2R-2]